ncbi:unnamed protein product [Urochloa decumbens]|uniref:Protein kinase domain-containing protein n=1 Tax=Urochloa decumbens TaxID=240449 RepID=A0ABC9ASL2_9POAL
MADPLGSLEKIVKLALTIKEAVDTVRQNKEECQQIRTRAVRVSSLLSRLPETGMAADPAMCDALEDLEDSLRRAHMLVAACQESTTVCLYCTAGSQARRLRRVQDDISQKVMLVVFATNIQTTIILTNIRIGAVPPAAGEMIETQQHLIRRSGSNCWAAPIRTSLNTNGRSEEEVETNNVPTGNESPSVPSLAGKMMGPIIPIAGRIRFSRRPAAGTFPAPSTQAPSAQGLPVPRPPHGEVVIGHPLLPPLKPPSLSTAVINEVKKAEKGLASRDVNHSLSASDSCLRKFSLSELEAATHHFSMENVIGSGASSTVYKGILHDGLVVAIKKFQNPYVRSEEHIDELHHISKLKHKNIVKLIGYGSELFERAEQFEDANVGAKEDKGTSYFFVEEYMPNGSLNKIINGLQLDWSSRFLLIQGIAQGLCYLHKENVVHLDVKPSNILLDSDMNPKITDFGIARVLNHKGVDICADIGTIAGTLGYMPPEYITDGALSKKQDVYGFGVTLLEIISGMSRFKSASGQASIQWAWKACQAGGTMELLDPSRFDELQPKEIERCVEVGLLCTQFDPTDRPGMVDALEMLRGEKALRIPVRPGYTKEPTSWFGGWRCLR